jgi:hypothetical protein
MSVSSWSVSKALKISKPEAARRQLEAAVRLYVSDGDPCAIHTLAAAAYNVVRDLRRSRKKQRPLLVKEFAKQHFGRQSELAFNRAENYLKHADRDPEEFFELEPEQALLLIWDASRGLADLIGVWPKLLERFDSWYVITHPRIAGPHFLLMSAIFRKRKRIPDKRTFFRGFYGREDGRRTGRN